MPRTQTGYAASYNRASVERALSHHFGPQPSWMRKGPGYSIETPRGILVTHSLRETYVLVVGCATVESRMERASRGDTGGHG